MRTIFAACFVALLAGCATPTTGVVPRGEGHFTVTHQGNGAWVQPYTLTATAAIEAAAHCEKNGKRYKHIHTKEIPAGALGRWPESEVLFKCE